MSPIDECEQLERVAFIRRETKRDYLLRLEKEVEEVRLEVQALTKAWELRRIALNNERTKNRMGAALTDVDDSKRH